jgi:beta-galactosidase
MVPYMPGKLEARGSSSGQQGFVQSREATGPGVRIVLRADRMQRSADGEDVAIVSASVVDAEGRIVPIANDEIEFRINGMGRLLAGNGERANHESDRVPKRRVFNGLSMTIAQAAMGPGTVRVEASSGQLESAAIDIVCKPARTTLS